MGTSEDRWALSGKALALWGAGIGVLGAIDLYLDRNHPEYTLSHTGRTWCRVDHPIGEAAFVGTWLGLTAWIVPHIVLPGRAKRAMLRAVPGDSTATKRWR